MPAGALKRKELPKSDRLGRALARQAGRGRVDGGEKRMVPWRRGERGCKRPLKTLWWRFHATGGGCKPPPAGKKERHQHKSSRFDPFTSACLRTGIPYQCFKVPVWPSGLRTTTGNWPVICMQTGRWHRPSSAAGWVSELNSRQINHLQRYASETHYRGRTASCNTAGEISHGGRGIRRPAAR